MQPGGGYSWSLRHDQRNTLTDDGEERPTNSIRTKRPLVNALALEQEIRQPRRVAQTTDLSPKPAASERVVEVGHGLSLDQHVPGKTIVPGVEVPNLDLDASMAKGVDHSTTPFVDVCEDAATVLCNHPPECGRRSRRAPSMHLIPNHLSTERREMA